MPAKGKSAGTARGRESGRKKQKAGGNILAAAVVLTSVLEAVRRIVLTNFIGDTGNAYFGAAFELYSVVLLLSTYGLPFAVSKMVSARSKKGQLRNTRRVFQGAFAFAVSAGTVLAILMFFLADILARVLLLEPLAVYSIRMLAPALLLSAVMGVYRGYFEGIGTVMPTAVSKILEQAGLLIVSLTAAKLVLVYGAQVGALLNNPNFGPAYAAAGSVTGYSVGAVFAVLFLVFVFAAFGKLIKKQAETDATKTVEPYGQILRILFMSATPSAFGMAVWHLCCLVDQRIYNQLIAVPGSGSAKWGVFYGKYRVLMEMGLIYASAVCASKAPAVTAAAGRGEHKRARELTGHTVRALTVTALPLVVCMTVLAEPLMDLFFPGKNALSSEMLRFGSSCILFSALAMVSGCILRGLGRSAAPALHSLIAFAVQSFAIYGMLEWLELDIMSAVYANLIFSVLLCLLNMSALVKALHYRQEWIRSFLIPAAVSGVLGVPVYLIHKGVSGLLGNGAGLAAAVAAGFLLYGVLMAALRAVNEREAGMIPCGRLFVRIAHILHLI